MSGDSDKHGWSGRAIIPSYKDFGWALDDLNEVVNFYFSLNRASVTCPRCDGSGLNPESHQLAEDFYDFAGTGRRWREKLTQDEVNLLWEQDRLWDFKELPTAAQVNDWASGSRIGHDAINRWLVVEQRARRLGVWGDCPHCVDGEIYTEDAAHLELTLWVIHPRKGASRGVQIERIEQDELPFAIAYLRQAAERNANRFSRLPVSESKENA